jgi:Tol biopolymer transport system component
MRAGAKYSPSGHLLFLRGGTLMAQAFSPDRLELSGDAFPVAEQAAGGRVATFSISANGTLSFIGGASPESRLVWFDRAGRELGQVGPVGVYENPVLSPDGRLIAFDRGTPADVWLLAVGRDGANRVTSDRAADRQPIWSPNGQTFAFASNRGGSEGLYERPVGGAGDDRLLIKSEVPVALSDWSRDGRYLAYAASGDLWAVPLDGDRTPLQLTTSAYIQELGTMFSPDGRWIAYQSDESSGITRSGEGDVYVQSFPRPGVKRQVSTGGGAVPRWSDDGKELYYLAADGMLMAVSVTARGPTLDVGAPQPLFRPPIGLTPLALRGHYSIARGDRFLIRLGMADLTIAVIVNWFEHLKRGAAAN